MHAIHLYLVSLGYLFRNELAEKNYLNRLEQIVAANRNRWIREQLYLPVILVPGSQEQFWEQFAFTLNSCIRA